MRKLVHVRRLTNYGWGSGLSPHLSLYASSCRTFLNVESQLAQVTFHDVVLPHIQENVWVPISQIDTATEWNMWYNPSCGELKPFLEKLGSNIVKINGGYVARATTTIPPPTTPAPEVTPPAPSEVSKQNSNTPAPARKFSVFKSEEDRKSMKMKNRGRHERTLSPTSFETKTLKNNNGQPQVEATPPKTQETSHHELHPELQSLSELGRLGEYGAVPGLISFFLSTKEIALPTRWYFPQKEELAKVRSIFVALRGSHGGTNMTKVVGSSRLSENEVKLMAAKYPYLMKVLPDGRVARCITCTDIGPNRTFHFLRDSVWWDFANENILPHLDPVTPITITELRSKSKWETFAYEKCMPFEKYISFLTEQVVVKDGVNVTKREPDWITKHIKVGEEVIFKKVVKLAGFEYDPKTELASRFGPFPEDIKVLPIGYNEWVFRGPQYTNPKIATIPLLHPHIPSSLDGIVLSELHQKVGLPQSDVEQCIKDHPHMYSLETIEASNNKPAEVRVVRCFVNAHIVEGSLPHREIKALHELKLSDTELQERWNKDFLDKYGEWNTMWSKVHTLSRKNQEAKKANLRSSDKSISRNNNNNPRFPSPPESNAKLLRQCFDMLGFGATPPPPPVSASQLNQYVDDHLHSFLIGVKRAPIPVSFLAEAVKWHSHKHGSLTECLGKNKRFYVSFDQGVPVVCCRENVQLHFKE